MCGVNKNDNVVGDFELYVHLIRAHLIICLIKLNELSSFGKSKNLDPSGC